MAPCQVLILTERRGSCILNSTSCRSAWLCAAPSHRTALPLQHDHGRGDVLFTRLGTVPGTHVLLKPTGKGENHGPVQGLSLLSAD